MFANLLQLFHRRSDSDHYETAFVKEVQTSPPEQRSRRSEIVLVVGWVLIVIKCVAVWWVVDAYKVPVNAWWIIIPTVFSAAVCTALYVWRD